MTPALLQVLLRVSCLLSSRTSLRFNVSVELRSPGRRSREFFAAVIQKVSLTAQPDGASLIYTSVKEMKNLDILYKYLVHRLYGFPFHCPAQVVERDAVFM